MFSTSYDVFINPFIMFMVIVYKNHELLSIVSIIRLMSTVYKIAQIVRYVWHSYCNAVLHNKFKRKIIVNFNQSNLIPGTKFVNHWYIQN